MNAEQVKNEEKTLNPEEAQTGEEAVTETPESATGDDTQQQQPAPQKKSGFRKRIDKLTRQKKELKEQLEAMKAELEQLKGVADPQEEDFDSYEDYIKAVAQAEFKRSRAQQVEQDAARLEEKTTDLDSKTVEEKKAVVDSILEQGLKKHPDYVQVVFSNPFLPEHLADAIIADDHADDIFYHLGQNPLESRRLANMTGDALHAELTKIKNNFSGKDKIPPPLSQVGGADAGSPEDLADDIPIDEWMRRRRKQLKR